MPNWQLAIGNRLLGIALFEPQMFAAARLFNVCCAFVYKQIMFVCLLGALFMGPPLAYSSANGMKLEQNSRAAEANQKQLLLINQLPIYECVNGFLNTFVTSKRLTLPKVSRCSCSYVCICASLCVCAYWL